MTTQKILIKINIIIILFILLANF